MNNKKKKFISIVIILIIIFSLLSSGCIDLIGSKETKTDYRYSTYLLFIDLEVISDNQIIIQIPFPSESCEYGNINEFWSDRPKLDFKTKDSSYGKTMQIEINIQEFYENYYIDLYGGYFELFYDKSLKKSSYSTQDINDSNKIWIYLNKTDYNKNINFCLWKDDTWDTENFNYQQIEYSGIMNKSFPSGAYYDDFWKFVKENTIILKDGWNNYPLTKGTTYKYVND